MHIREIPRDLQQVHARILNIIPPLSLDEELETRLLRQVFGVVLGRQPRVPPAVRGGVSLNDPNFQRIRRRTLAEVVTCSGCRIRDFGEISALQDL